MRQYEIRSGRRTVKVQRSISAQQAVVDYVRSFGSVESEIRIVGVDSVMWRGARFTASAIEDSAADESVRFA